MGEHSAAYERFLACVAAPIRGPDEVEGYDLGPIFALNDEERADAARHLARMLDGGSGDPRLVETLGVIGTDEAWAALDRALDGPCDAMLIRVAHYMYRWRKSPRAVRALEACVEAESPWIRYQALHALGALGAPLSQVMIEALEDPDWDVRVGAVNAVFQCAGLHRWDNIIGSRVFDLGLGVTSRLSAVRRQAVAELREVIAQLNAGETPEALGLVAEDRGTSEALDALIDSVDDPEAPLDAAMVEGLAPHERRYAAEFLSRPLARGDERVIPLLEALDSPWAKLVLEAARTEPWLPT